jgi:sterol 3beta-glucosyltransferase
MHITILTLGSRGDVIPYLALGGALQRVGHEVRVITFEDFQSTVRSKGLDFHPVRGEMRLLLSQDSGLSLTESGLSVMRMALSLLRIFQPLAHGFAEDLSAPELRQTDLLINQLPGGIYGLDLAEAAGIPMSMAAVMPLAPTRCQPMLAFPRWPARIPGYNIFTHWLAYQVVWWIFRSTVSRWRTQDLGLSRPPFWGVWRNLQNERFAVLNAYSPHVAPPPADWGSHVHTTGAWSDTEEEWRPPDDLVRFIESGSQPIYIGFGSMPTRRPQRITLAVIEALERTGLRAVIDAGWGGLSPRQLPSGVHPVDRVPHNWLFPQMAAVVHHGGSGTTHAGLRAGVPSLLVPFVFDQFYWAERVKALGVGPAAIPNRKLTADRLTSAFDRLRHDDDMRRRAAEVGRVVRSEGGVAQAVSIIESLLMGSRAEREAPAP